MAKRYPVPEALQRFPSFSESKRKTIPTATWRRESEDISVVRLDLPLGSFFADYGSEVQLTGPGALYRLLGQATTLCNQRNVIVWAPNSEHPTAGFSGSINRAGGALLVAHMRTPISLKEWRNVRKLLDFKPRRWDVPTKESLDAWTAEMLIYHCIYEGTTTTDGHTHLLSLCTPGLISLTSKCWDLQSEPDSNPNDYTADYFSVQGKKTSLRLVKWSSSTR